MGGGAEKGGREAKGPRPGTTEGGRGREEGEEKRGRETEGPKGLEADEKVEERRPGMEPAEEIGREEESTRRGDASCKGGQLSYLNIHSVEIN